MSLEDWYPFFLWLDNVVMPTCIGDNTKYVTEVYWLHISWWHGHGLNNYNLRQPLEFRPKKSTHPLITYVIILILSKSLKIKV